MYHDLNSRWSICIIALVFLISIFPVHAKNVTVWASPREYEWSVIDIEIDTSPTEPIAIDYWVEDKYGNKLTTLKTTTIPTNEFSKRYRGKLVQDNEFLDRCFVVCWGQYYHVLKFHDSYLLYSQAGTELTNPIRKPFDVPFNYTYIYVGIGVLISLISYAYYKRRKNEKNTK